MEQFQFDPNNTDIFVYIGEINRQGYTNLSNEIAAIHDSRKENALLCLATFGGDPDAGYRIGRCLQHYYEGKVSIFAPSLCKSSGTLTAIAANHLIIGNQGELGPLDIQLRKTDEIGEQSSGLDIFKAVNFLEARVMEQFYQYLPTIRFGSGISTRLSADIAAKLIQSVIQPIASQIDPIKIGEHQRAIGIAQKYGELLNEMTKTLKPNALATLIAGYPSHSFVIDRKEAEKLFNKVYKPCDTLHQLFQYPQLHNFDLLGQNPPFIFRRHPEDNIQKDAKNEFTEKSEQIAEPAIHTSNGSGETGRSASSSRIESTSKSSSKKRNRGSSTSL